MNADPRLNAFRQPPHNVEAEKATLGAILANPRAFDAVAEFLRPEHFALAQNGQVFEACARLRDRGQVADPVTLKGYFEADNKLAEIGGPAYLAELAGSAVGVINAGAYGRLVVDLARKRDLIGVGQNLVDRAFDADVDVTSDGLIEETEAALFELAAGAVTAREVDLSSIADDALRAAEKARESPDGLLGLSTGLADLDRVLGGLVASDLDILAGRPGMGKTALGLSIARHVAGAGTPTGFFSLEMSSRQLFYRLIAAQAGIEQSTIARGRADDAEWFQAREAATAIRRLPLHIDDTPGLAVDQLRSRARRMKRRHGVGLIVVDHLGLLRAKAENRTQEITRISGGLKALAKELDVPVLALCQLSRGVEGREDKRPTLADLRDSGSIEQDADSVTFLYRPAYYLERQRPVPKASETESAYRTRLTDWEADLERIRHDASLIVAKNRHGPLAEIALHCEIATGRFGCRARDRGAA